MSHVVGNKQGEAGKNFWLSADTSRLSLSPGLQEEKRTQRQTLLTINSELLGPIGRHY